MVVEVDVRGRESSSGFEPSRKRREAAGYVFSTSCPCSNPAWISSSRTLAVDSPRRVFHEDTFCLSPFEPQLCLSRDPMCSPMDRTLMSLGFGPTLQGRERRLHLDTMNQEAMKTLTQHDGDVDAEEHQVDQVELPRPQGPASWS